MSDHAPVHPHGPLEQAFEGVWWVTGTFPMAPMMRIARNMVVVRDGDQLTLLNAVRLDEAGLGVLERLGRVAHVVKLGMHGVDDAFYVDRYGARMWALEGARSAVPVTDTLAPGNAPVGGMEVFVFEQTRAPEAALLLPRDGGILLTCDSVQHWAPSPFNSALARLATALMGFRYPAQIGRPRRKLMTPRGGSLRPDYERLVKLPFQHIIGAHGGVCRGDGPRLLGETIERELG